MKKFTASELHAARSQQENYEKKAQREAPDGFVTDSWTANEMLVLHPPGSSNQSYLLIAVT